MRRRVRSFLAGTLTVLSLSSSSGSTPGAAATGSTADDSVRRVNAALRSLIGAIDADELFAVVDLEHGELRLHHGRALLRTCPIQRLEIPADTAVLQSLAQRPRRYTHSDPHTRRGPGVFDWEYYLVAAATDDCALYFSGGLLVYASDAWVSSPPPRLKLTGDDLRALYDALDPDTDVILLPQGWDAPGERPETDR